MGDRDALKQRMAEIATRIGSLSTQLNELQEEFEAGRDDLEAALAAPSPSQPESEPQPASPPQESNGTAQGELQLNHINDALKTLAAGKTQEGILDIFLGEAQSFVQRAILFLHKEGKYTTWKGFGFNPDQIQSIELQDTGDPVVRSAQQRRLIYRSDEEASSQMPWLQSAGELPDSTLCIPLVFEDETPVVFYGDSKGPIAIDSLELLTHLTVLILKNNYLLQLFNAQRDGQPAAAEPAAAAAAAAEAAEPEAALEPEPVAEPEPTPEPEPVAEPVEAAEAAEPAPVEEEAVAEPAQETEAEASPVAEAAPEVEAEPEVEIEAEPEAEAEPAAEELSAEPELPAAEETEVELDMAAENEITFEIDLDATPPMEDAVETAAEEEPSMAEPPPAEPVQEDVELEPFDASPPEAETIEVVEAAAEEEPALAEDLPPPAAEAVEPEAAAPPQEAAAAEAVDEPEEAPPEAAPSISPEEEKKAHDEARRFARLLVSEIKLYNEEQVEEGRENGDLYDRLTRDIDRSRDMYLKRVHPHVASTVDYFHEEMVRILAKGDESLLGPNYIGSSN